MTTMTETRHFNLSDLANATADEIERRGTIASSLGGTGDAADCAVCALGGMAAAYVGNPFLGYDLAHEGSALYDPFFVHFVKTFGEEVSTVKASELVARVYGWFDWSEDRGGINADQAKAVAALREFAKPPAGLNPTPQTADEALAIIRAAVRERGPQFNYRKHFGVGEREEEASKNHSTAAPAALCRYIENGKPGCIVGLGLHLAGRDLGGLDILGDAYAVGLARGFGRDATSVLSAAQSTQDLGGTWGEALAAAEARAAQVEPRKSDYVLT